MKLIGHTVFWDVMSCSLIDRYQDDVKMKGVDSFKTMLYSYKCTWCYMQIYKCYIKVS